MVGGIFDPEVDQLPARIPIFPLPSALLLPGGQLPLNIFEPRYLDMVNDCMKSDKFIGMIQPKNKKNNLEDLHKIGCLGKITNFQDIVKQITFTH